MNNKLPTTLFRITIYTPEYQFDGSVTDGGNGTYEAVSTLTTADQALAFESGPEQRIEGTEADSMIIQIVNRANDLIEPIIANLSQ